ncbi:MAG: radical SAM protein [Candidatus Omnitrophica bacterium]|nr:radical SAM protein [Candidatus Omnitrophota bacterium]
MVSKICEKADSILMKFKLRMKRQRGERVQKRMLLDSVWNGLDPKFQRDNQYLGRRATVGCVALEITQRCNLDCSLCYLSENSEKVKNDIVLDELKRRLNRIYQDFGIGTKVQITGGDPTLRKREELVKIVRYSASLGLEPGLMTNGIYASRELLGILKEAGLKDVSFHVDITQKRRGYGTERELNGIREEYIERVRGLGLFALFSTTVCDKNLDEIPDLVRFFIRHSDVVSMCSFQMQADVGRSVLGKRCDRITFQSVTQRIEDGARTCLAFENLLMGHPECHRVATIAVAGDTVIDLMDNPKIVEKFICEAGDLDLDRSQPYKSVFKILRFVLRNPSWYGLAVKFAVRKLLRYWIPIMKAQFRINRLTFFCQNFMDSDNLNMERIHHCLFKTATGDGAISMCLHNAKRDEFILPRARFS